jgi:hypothetical protein
VKSLFSPIGVYQRSLDLGGLLSQSRGTSNRNPGSSSAAECAVSFGETAALERRGPMALGLALPDLVSMAKRAGNRKAQNSYWLAPPGISHLLDMEESPRQAWQTGGGEGSTRSHPSRELRESFVGSSEDPR